MNTQLAPAAKKARTCGQSREQLSRQASVLRGAVTCKIPECINVFKDVAFVCRVCNAGVCEACYHIFHAAPNISNEHCHFCNVYDGNGPFERQIRGPLVELAASVVQRCAGTGCRQTGTWAQLDAHAAWCIDSPVQCPICIEPVVKVKRCNFRAHLVSKHKADLVATTGNDIDSESDDEGNLITESNNGTWRAGAWQPTRKFSQGQWRFDSGVACVCGPCRCWSLLPLSEACQCPFVVARAVAFFPEVGGVPMPSSSKDPLCYTHVAVSTVFAEIATFDHPMGFCEISWCSKATADRCGTIVKARSACSGPVRALSGGGPDCDVFAAASRGQSLCVIHESHHAPGLANVEGPSVHFRFSSLSANRA